MPKLDYGKLAGGLKLSTEDGSDEEDQTDGEGMEGEGEGDEGEGSLGDKAIAAMKAGNGKAFEEAVKQIAGV